MFSLKTHFLFLAFFLGCSFILIGDQEMLWQEQVKLKIMASGNPVLRQQARELLKDEILKPSFQELIQLMKNTMRDAPGVGLAAPQVGLPIQLIVIEDLPDYHKNLTQEQREERDRREVPFHVVINPKIYIEQEDQALFFEGCLSVPNLMGIVPRALAVRVECLNEKAEPVVIHAKGWYARILQHEIDHLNGTLFVDHVEPRTLMTLENYDRFWKGKSIQEVRSY